MIYNICIYKLIIVGDYKMIFMTGTGCVDMSSKDFNETKNFIKPLIKELQSAQKDFGTDATQDNLTELFKTLHETKGVIVRKYGITGLTILHGMMAEHLQSVSQTSTLLIYLGLGTAVAHKQFTNTDVIGHTVRIDKADIPDGIRYW